MCEPRMLRAETVREVCACLTGVRRNRAIDALPTEHVKCACGRERELLKSARERAEGRGKEGEGRGER
eukprot:2199923-Rhodomonas_salina.1